jgi:hypothetical protein
MCLWHKEKVRAFLMSENQDKALRPKTPDL